MKKNKRFTSIILSILLTISICIPIYNKLDVKADSTFKLLQGDLNQDGIVSIADTRKALRGSAGIDPLTDIERKLADINFDGNVSIEDTRKILRFAADIDKPIEFIFNEWYTTSEPTCQKEGTEMSYCEEYDLSISRPIPKGYHSFNKGYCIHCGFKEILSAKINVLNTELHFGDSYNTIVNKLGEPTQIYYDKTPDENNLLRYLVYHNNYENYTLITLHSSDNLISVYTTDKTSFVEYPNGSKVLFDKAEDNRTVNGVYFKTFTDTLATNPYIYACQYAVKYDSMYIHGKANVETLNKILLDLTNVSRKINNIPIVAHSDDAKNVALAHSVDMYKNNYFSHRNLEDKNVLDRMNDAGVKVAYVGENILRSSYCSPFVYHDAWYNSKSHRRVMLNSQYTHVGIGTHIADIENGYTTYSVYSTQNFITPK